MFEKNKIILWWVEDGRMIIENIYPTQYLKNLNDRDRIYNTKRYYWKKSKLIMHWFPMKISSKD